MTFQKVQQTPLLKVFANYQTCLLTNKEDRNRKKSYLWKLVSFKPTPVISIIIIKLL